MTPRATPSSRTPVATIAAEIDGIWAHATDDPYIAIHCPTVNVLGFLQRHERGVGAGICQTAEVDDFLLFGEVLAEAVPQIDRRVALLATGGISHGFWPLRELRAHESSDPVHVITPEDRAADERILAQLVVDGHAG